MGQIYSPDKVLRLLASLSVWRRGDERAPHKPLLALLALGKLGRNRLAPFEEWEAPLKNLLEEFGPPRKSFHPEYPFWRLQADQLWEVPEGTKLTRRKGNTDPLKTELIRFHVKGGFPEPVYQAFRRNPLLVREAAQQILNAHFPESLHSEILNAVGLDLDAPSNLSRHPHFRPEVLDMYGHSCAFCGYSVRLGNADLGLDAAHIMWHQAGGPDIPSNGLACCSVHHRALDRGAISVGQDSTVLVSLSLHGNSSCDTHFIALMGKQLRAPGITEARPDEKFLAWHRKQVFRGPARAA